MSIVHSFAAPKDSIYVTLIHANIIDLESGTVVPNRTIVLAGQFIEKIVKSESIKPRGKVIDLQGAYVMPGLIDAHVHVSNIKVANEAVTRSHLAYFLQHGITVVRDAGGNAPVLHKMQEESRSGKAKLAEVFYAAFMGGRWYYERGAGPRKEPYTAWEQMLNPGDDLDKAMQQAKDCGATGLKLYHSFDKDFLIKIVKKAKQYGLKTWGHAMMYPALPHEVADAGVDVLSHIYMVESYAKDSLMYRRSTPQYYKDSVKSAVDISRFCREMKKHHTILDPTLCVSFPREKWIFAKLRKVHEAGVRIAAGTDQIVNLQNPRPYLLDELNYYVDSCGFSRIEALRAATIHGAATVGMEKQVGLVRVGRRADLLILDENPLENLKSLEKIKMVFQFGRRVDEE